MLVQRCALDQHRLILSVSVTKPQFSANGFVGQFTQHQYRALVDTGAQRTVVSRSVVAEQALVRIGHMEFSSLHGPQTHSRFLALIGLWAKRVENSCAAADFENSETSLFAIENPYEVVDMANNANFDIILGFDVLKMFSFGFDAQTKQFQIIIKP